MKGGKVIGKVVAFVLVVCAVFGLSSCSRGSARAKHMKSEEVTEAEWEKIFGYGVDYDAVFSDCEVTFRSEVTEETYIDGIKSKTTEVLVYDLAVDGSKQYQSLLSELKGKYGDIKIDESEPLVEYYDLKNDDGTYTRYEKTATGEWTTSVYSYGVAINRIRSLLNLLYWNRYSDYVFSEERKGYIEPDDFEGEKYVVKFDEEGRICGFLQEYEYFSGGVLRHSETSCVFTYGKAEIKLPSI